MADSQPCAAATGEHGFQPVESDQTTNKAIQSVLLEKNSQDESRGNLSHFVTMADEVLNKQERENLIELYRNYEPLENTGDLELQDLLDHIHVAHMKYETFSPELQSFRGHSGQAIQMSNSNVNHEQTVAVRCGSPDKEIMPSEPDPACSQNKSVGSEAYYSQSTSRNTGTNPDVILSETSNLSHVNNTRILDVTSSSQTPSPTQSLVVMPKVANATLPIFTLELDDSQSSLGNQSLSREEASSSDNIESISGTDHFNATTVTSQPLSDETNFEDFQCCSRLIDIILNLTVSHEASTPISWLNIQQSQTPETSQERKKRKKELWKFISEYWKDKKLRRNCAKFS